MMVPYFPSFASTLLLIAHSQADRKARHSRAERLENAALTKKARGYAHEQHRVRRISCCHAALAHGTGWTTYRLVRSPLSIKLVQTNRAV